jgi:hypothetical protein
MGDDATRSACRRAHRRGMGAGWLGLRDPVTTRGRRELGAHLTAEVVGPAHGDVRAPCCLPGHRRQPAHVTTAPLSSAARARASACGPRAAPRTSARTPPCTRPAGSSSGSRGSRSRSWAPGSRSPRDVTTTRARDGGVTGARASGCPGRRRRRAARARGPSSRRTAESAPEPLTLPRRWSPPSPHVGPT